MSGWDHIFISYATEDIALADWLARKLAAAGYAVWYDRLKLLGGEPWPQDIDEAIKNRTFRMLGLLSRASVSKPNPTREWTMAQALAKERNIPDFFVPLNVDGLRATELPWTVSDTNYITFHEGWARGLADVLKKLSAVEAPRVLPNARRLAIASVEDHHDILRDVPETVVSNVLDVVALPDTVARYKTSKAVSARESWALRRRWPIRWTSDHYVLAFDPPPQDVSKEFGCSTAGGALWRGVPTIDGIKSRDVVVSLIHASLEASMAARRLHFSEETRRWYVPAGLLKGNWLTFHRPDGFSSRALALGERTHRSGAAYRYALGPSMRVLQGTEDSFAVVVRVGVHLTDTEGRALTGRQVVSRRKALCRDWWNEEWLARILGLIELLRGGEDNIRFGSLPSTEIVLSGTPRLYRSPRSVAPGRGELVDTDYLGSGDHEEEDEGP